MRPILIILFFMLMNISAKSQSGKWQPGHFTDIKGNKETGFIRINPSDHGPIKDEGFIEFKEDKGSSFKLSASDLKSFVVGKDSFVVAHAPAGETWAKNEFDFVKVALDEDVKLYVTYGGKGSGGRGGGLSVTPGLGVGVGAGAGTGGFGAGVGGGVAIPIGGTGGGSYGRAVYYYGENTAAMKRLTDANFADVMTDIMGDEPDVVDKIAAKVYILENIDRLIAYFNQVKVSHKSR